MDYMVFNVHTYVNACVCKRGRGGGGMWTPLVSALKVDSEAKFPCRPGESKLCQRRAGTTLYQLSYTPSPVIRIRQIYSRLKNSIKNNSVFRAQAQDPHPMATVLQSFHLITAWEA